jgi:hypothetical protein
MQPFRSFHTAERTIEGGEAAHTVRKGRLKIRPLAEDTASQYHLPKRAVLTRGVFYERSISRPRCRRP